MNKQTQKTSRSQAIAQAIFAGLRIVFFAVALTGVFLYTRVGMHGQNLQQVEAATSDELNFQARLFNSAGNIVDDGTYNIEFKIYDSAAAGGSAQGACVGGATDDCQWVETRTGGNQVTVKNGYFSVRLGSVAAFGSSIQWDQDLYLTMNIGGTGAPSWDGEMTPRIKLTSVPYAQAAGQLVQTNGANRGTLNFAGLTNNPNLLLPDIASGTLLSDQILTTRGDLLYRDATSTTRLALGGAGSCLRSDGTDAAWGSCSGTGDVIQNGNSFGTNMIIGTNDAYDLELETGTVTRLTINASTGNVTLTSDLAVNGGDITSSGALNITPGGTLTAGVLTENSSLRGNITTIFSNSILGVGTNAVEQIISVGNTTGATSVTVSAGTGGISIGNNGISNTIQIGNTTGAVAQTVNIGNNATASSTSTVTIGSTIGASATTIQAGSGGILLSGNATVSGNLAVQGTSLNLSNSAKTVSLANVANALNFDSDTLSIDALNNRIGIGTAAPQVSLQITNGNDASLASGGYIVLGDTSGQNISFDNNEIQARNNGASSTLNLQLDGGSVSVGASLSGYKLSVNAGAGSGLGVVSSNYSIFTSDSNLSTYGYFRPVNTDDANGYFELGGYDLNGASQGGRNLLLNSLGGNVGIGGDTTPDALFSVGSTSQFQVNSSGQVTYVNGTANNDSAVCRNASGQLASCNSTFLTSANAFIQNGNDFGGNAVLGTNGAGQTLSFETANAVRAIFDTSGNFTFQGNSTIASTGTLSLTSAAASAFNITTGTTGALTLDTGTTGAINIGTNTNAKTITIGNGTGATSLVLNAGTGPINIGTNTIARTISIGNTTGASALNLSSGTGALTINSGTGTINIGSTASARSVNLGTGAAAQTVTVGSTNTTSTTTVTAGTGGLNLGNAGVANTIQLGNTTGAVAQTINIGNNATASSTSNVTIGSIIGGSATTIQSGTGNLNITTQGTGSLNIGNNAVAQTINIGNTTGATNVFVRAGTSGTVYVGDPFTAQTVQIGSNTAGSTTSILGNSAINIGAAGVANTIQIGNTTGAVAQTINLGNNATTSSTSTVTIGSTIGTSATTIQAGSGNINLTGNTDISGTLFAGTGDAFQVSSSGVVTYVAGAADNDVLVCRNSSGQLATCNTASLGGNAFIQNGNDFGGNAVLGTNGAGQTLSFETANAVRAIFDTSGNFTFQGNSTIASTGTLSLTSAAASAFNITTGTTGALTLDSGTTGAINIGTNTNAKTITIGNGTGATSLAFNSGTGGITLGSNGIANTIQIGNTTGAVAQTVNLGTNSTVSSTTTVNVGSTIGTSTTNIRSGSGNINLQSNSNITGNLQVNGGFIGTSTDTNLLELGNYELNVDGRVAIGSSSSPSGWLDITAATDDQLLILRAAAGQTAAIIDVRSNGALDPDLFRVQANGNLQIGGGNFGTFSRSTASTSSTSTVLESGNVSGATSNSGSVSFRSGASTTSGNTGAVFINTGAAANGNSGSITIDPGTAGGGTTGAIFIGDVNASAITIGRTGANLTIQSPTIFSGLATDITTGTNQDLTVVANGTGIIDLNDTVRIGTLGAADTDTIVCRNAAGQLATCSNAALTGTAFIQNGNSFGATGVLGTADTNDLHIISDGTARIVVEADGDVAFNTNQLYIDEGTGNVAIGTTNVAPGKLSIAGSDGVSALSVYTSVNSTAGNALGFSLQPSLESVDGGTSVAQYIASTYNVSGAETLANAYGIQVAAPNKTGSGTITNYYGLRVTAGSSATNNYAAVFEGGNVGIGTTSPSSLLHVSSGTAGRAGLILEADTDNNDESDTSYILFSQDGGTTRSIIGQSGANDVDPQGNAYAEALSNALIIGTMQADELQLGTNNAVRLTIDTAGNVGIGTTAPASKLEVDTDPGENVVALRVEQGDTTNNNVALQVTNAGTGNSLQINTDDLVVFGNGNIGVGTAVDNGYQLNVFGDGRIGSGGAAPGYITPNGNDLYVEGQFEAAGTAGSYINNLSLGTYGPTGNSGYLVTTGRIGIGTNGPSTSLDIGGYGASIVGGGNTGIRLLQTVNGIGGLEFRNTDTGTSADTRFIAGASDNSYVAIFHPGVNNSSTLFNQTRSSASFIANLANGGTARNLVIGTVDGTDLIFGSSNTARGRVTAAGSFLFGGTNQFSVTSTGTVTTTASIGIGTTTTSGDLTFGEGASRTINVQTRTSNAAGNALTISAGTAGSGGSAFGGGTLTLQGGAAAGTGNANGGAVTLSGGAGVGTGTQGLVNLATSAFTSAAVQNISSPGTTPITAGNVDNFSSLPLFVSASPVIVTVPDPGQTTIGRILYISARSGSTDFTLRLNAARTPIDITMKANSTATLIWNGTDWTAAGASSSTDLQAAYNNTVSSAGGAELVLNAPGGNADGLTIRNNATTPITGGILEVQTSIGTNLFSVNNLGSELAANGGSETSSTFSTNWTAVGASTVSRTTTAGQFITGQAAAQVVTPATANTGIRNNLTANPVVSTTYQVSFAAKVSSGTFSTLQVVYSRDGGTDIETCANYSTQSLSTTDWRKVTCTITTDSTTATNPDLIIRQTDATARTFWIENLSFVRNDSSTEPSHVQIGGGITGGQVTLFTLDRSSAPPVANGNETYLGSMYYDTTSGRIQCYEADGWGACGSAPNNYVNLTPEYPGSVLNGTGVGTMTADFCANQASISFQVNTSFCANGESKNYYNWTSPQATQQTYSIYITYQLPAAFKAFESNDTVQLTARTSNTTNGAVTYEMFRNEGGAITRCGTETTVTTSANVWQTVGINGNEADGCGFSATSADDFVIFKINMKANSNANVYASTLSFTTIGQ